MKIIKLLVIFLFLMWFECFAQEVEITGIKKENFKGVEAIQNKGFFTHYVKETSQPNVLEFFLEVYDLDLHLIKSLPIQLSKGSKVVGGEFNGKDFLFAFSDSKKKQTTIVSVDEKGNVIKQITRQHNKAATPESMVIYRSLDGDGFYITQTVKEYSWGFNIEKVDRNLETVWNKTFKNTKGYLYLEVLSAGKDQLLVVASERLNSVNPGSGKLLCLDSKNGRTNYEYPLYDGKITTVPSDFFFDSDGNILLAGMYFDGKKWDDKNSDGLFFLTLSKTGEKQLYKTYDWKSEFPTVMQALSRNFVIGSKPKLLFHEIKLKANGNFQMIAETFKIKEQKTVSLYGVASTTFIELSALDFLVFELSPLGDVVDIQRIPKSEKIISLNISDFGTTPLTGASLAYYLKRNNLLAFGFTSFMPNSQNSILTYKSFDDAVIVKSNPYVGIVTLSSDKSIKESRVELSSKTAFLGYSPEDHRNGVLPAKDGYFCVYHFDKKAQTIFMKLEAFQHK